MEPAAATPTGDAEATKESKRTRRRGSGEIFVVRPGVFRVDLEVHRDSVTGRRRRVSRTVYGTLGDAEVALASLRLADHQNRLPQTATNARSVKAVLDLYVADAEAGRVRLAPATVVTTRSAAKSMARTVLNDGREFGALQLSKLTWREIEDLYSSMQRDGLGADRVRRCATVLSRALERAKKMGLLDTNPEKDADRPKSVRTKPFAPLAADVQNSWVAESEVSPRVDLESDQSTLGEVGLRYWVGLIAGIAWWCRPARCETTR